MHHLHVCPPCTTYMCAPHAPPYMCAPPCTTYMCAPHAPPTCVPPMHHLHVCPPCTPYMCAPLHHLHVCLPVCSKTEVWLAHDVRHGHTCTCILENQLTVSHMLLLPLLLPLPKTNPGTLCLSLNTTHSTYMHTTHWPVPTCVHVSPYIHAYNTLASTLHTTHWPVPYMCVCISLHTCIQHTGQYLTCVCISLHTCIQHTSDQNTRMCSLLSQ